MGQTYAATVRRMMDYGAFVELGGTGGTQALLHISELDTGRVRCRSISLTLTEDGQKVLPSLELLLGIAQLERCCASSSWKQPLLDTVLTIAGGNSKPCPFKYLGAPGWALQTCTGHGVACRDASHTSIIECMHHGCRCSASGTCCRTAMS